MSGGMVAEKNRFCRLRGNSRTMRRIGLTKPRSSIWSTSSRTRNSTALERGDARVEMVEQTPRRRHQHVEALGQRADLRAVRHAAEDDGDVERQAGREVAEALGDLAGEFARRREHENARPAARRRLLVGDQAVEDRQREGRRLAGAGLGDADQVASLHQDGNGLGLDRGRLGVAHLGQRGDERRGKAEAVEIFQVMIFQTAAKAREIPRGGLVVVKGDAPRVRATGRFYKQALDRRTKKPFTQPARIGRSMSGMRLIHDAAHNVKERRSADRRRTRRPYFSPGRGRRDKMAARDQPNL